MTYSLALSNGDLVQQGSQLAIVSGTDKLYQDVTLWLTERYGGDRFHPTYGSALESFIGGVIGTSTQAQAYNEILRVLANYQNQQDQAFRANPNAFSVSELLYSVDNVSVTVSYDTVQAIISVSNPASSTTITISPSL